MPTEPTRPDAPDAAWHALLHDLRGCLGGLKATLDLREGDAGLDARSAGRMEQGVQEGLALVELAKVLRFGPWPDGGCEEADSWAIALEADLAPLAAAFRGKAALKVEGQGPWPGQLLRSFVLSLARLLMPQALPDALRIEAEGRGDAWMLSFRPILSLPIALQAEGEPRDLHGLWVRAAALRCRMAANLEGDRLILRIPRGPEGLPPVE